MESMYHIPVTIILIVVAIWQLSMPMPVVYLVSLILTTTYLMRARSLAMNEWKSIVQDCSIIGHRCCTSSPENTVAALHEALEHNMKAVEIDIALSKDGVLFLMHDSSLDRTTNGSGLVNEWLWEDIKRLSASKDHSESHRFPHVMVPSLEEFLTTAQNHGVKVFLDVKGGWDPQVLAQKIIEMKRLFPDLHKWLVVCSFYPQTLYAVKWYDPTFATILTHRPNVLSYRDCNQSVIRNDELWKRLAAPHADLLLQFANYYFFWWFCGVNGFFINEEVYNVYEDKWWRKKGVSLFAWTVNSPQRKEYLRWMGIPYITDDVKQGS